jgi:hypothetical protein
MRDGTLELEQVLRINRLRWHTHSSSDSPLIEQSFSVIGKESKRERGPTEV